MRYEGRGGFPPLLSGRLSRRSYLQVQLGTAIPAEGHCWSRPGYLLLPLLGPGPPPAGAASGSGSSERMDGALAAQLLLSRESGSVCHTHSRQDLNTFCKKNATKVLILHWQNSQNHLQPSHLLKFCLTNV